MLLPICIVMGWLWDPYARFPSNCPPCGADDTHAENAKGVLDPLGAGVVDVHDGREGGGAAAARGGGVAAVAAWEADVAGVAAAEKGRVDAVLAAGGGFALALRVLHVVVYALGDEDEVGETWVGRSVRWS